MSGVRRLHSFGNHIHHIIARNQVDWSLPLSTRGFPRPCHQPGMADIQRSVRAFVVFVVMGFFVVMNCATDEVRWSAYIPPVVRIQTLMFDPKPTVTTPCVEYFRRRRLRLHDFYEIVGITANLGPRRPSGRGS